MLGMTSRLLPSNFTDGCPFRSVVLATQVISVEVADPPATRPAAPHVVTRSPSDRVPASDSALRWMMESSTQKGGWDGGGGGTDGGSDGGGGTDGGSDGGGGTDGGSDGGVGGTDGGSDGVGGGIDGGSRGDGGGTDGGSDGGAGGAGGIDGGLGGVDGTHVQ